MKRRIGLIVMVAAALFSYGAQAQNTARFPRMREKILQAKLHEIRKSMNLDQSVMDRFRPIYAKYEEEIAGMNFRDQERLMRIDPDSLTSVDAEKMVLKQLQNARKLIDIREKYYYEFKTVLKPQQIIKLYQTEAEIRRKVMQEMRRRSEGRRN